MCDITITYDPDFLEEWESIMNSPSYLVKVLRFKIFRPTLDTMSEKAKENIIKFERPLEILDNNTIYLDIAHYTEERPHVHPN